jgi:hypothetical protein
MRSHGGAFIDGSAAKVRALDGWGQVGLADEGADVGAGRDDLIDPVEDLVGERDVEASEQVVTPPEREFGSFAGAYPVCAREERRQPADLLWQPGAMLDPEQYLSAVAQRLPFEAPLLVHAQARLRRTPSASTPARRSTKRSCGGK